MLKQVIVIRADLKMGKGKACAQVAHASLEAYLKVEGRVRERWRREGAKKVVVRVNSEEELREVFRKALKLGLPAVLIRDAGLTQLPPGTPTAVGIGPAEEEKVDSITGGLKLY